MLYDFDVAIVGGGPIGSSLAYKLALQGISVAVFDKKKFIGYPLQCAGILSKSVYELNDLPDDIIINKVNGAFLHSPNYTLKVEKNETEALIIDRVGYDQYLINRAVNHGVKVFLQHKVIDLNLEEGIINTNKGEFKAKIIVGADGCNSIVSKIIGNKLKYSPACQYLVKLSDEDTSKLSLSHVDVFVNNSVLPGFLWSIPLGDNLFRIGLFSDNKIKRDSDILDDFLNNRGEFENNNLNITGYEIVEKYRGNIPFYDKNKIIVKDRAILIGDAASQVKPTTGGGLIYGFSAMDIAVDTIKDALLKDDMSVLKNYSKEFKKLYSGELNTEVKVHNTLNSLSDRNLDYLFKKIKENNGERLISEYGDMDKQSILVKEVLKRGLLFKITPKVISSKISRIWS
ncbi:MAG: geranylgeranyl reductase family protein [Methanobrevibacter sp.]